MEIKFVWIEDYKNIKKTGFNFNNSNDTLFKYDDKELILRPNPDKTPKGFFSDNITSVTGIVGKNGAGKTNLSEFIYYNLVHVRNGSLAHFPTGKGIIILNNKIFIQETLRLENQSQLEDNGFEIYKYKLNPLDNKSSREWVKMEANRYIYYNPILDMRFKNWVNGSDNIQDISTTYLLSSDIYNSSKHYNNSQFDRKQKNTEKLLAYRRNEKIRESNILLNYPGIYDFLTNHVNQILISIDSIRNNQLLNLEYYGTGKSAEDKVKKNSDEIYNYLNGLERDVTDDLIPYKIEEDEFKSVYVAPSEIKKQLFKKLFFINFFRAYWKIYNKDLSQEILENYFVSGQLITLDNSLNEDFKLLNENLESIILNSNFQQERNIVYNDISGIDETWESTFSAIFDNLQLSLEEDKEGHLNEVIRISKLLLKDNLHFHYEFLNSYSSGEQKLLNFYSRLYYTKDEILFVEKRNYNTKSERIIIFIDEGEVGMHPEWQRVFFNKAINFISELFKEYKIQLIFTTHSPFVLSELPQNNVIFLDKKVNGDTKLVNFDQEKTFGANIYSLFANSFFMNEGTIGEFSKNKIEWVLNKLESDEKLSTLELQHINFIIFNIGEPLIKMELEKLFRQKSEVSELDFLRSKIRQLEEKIKDNTND